MNLSLFGFTKTKTGAKTAPRSPKLSYFDGRAPQLSAQVNHGTPAARVIGHKYIVYGYNRIRINIIHLCYDLFVPLKSLSWRIEDQFES